MGRLKGDSKQSNPKSESTWNPDRETDAELHRAVYGPDSVVVLTTLTTDNFGKTWNRYSDYAKVIPATKKAEAHTQTLPRYTEGDRICELADAMKELFHTRHHSKKHAKPVWSIASITGRSSNYKAMLEFGMFETMATYGRCHAEAMTGLILQAMARPVAPK